jgi:hypothetical protein
MANCVVISHNVNLWNLAQSTATLQNSGLYGAEVSRIVNYSEGLFWPQYRRRQSLFVNTSIYTGVYVNFIRELELLWLHSNPIIRIALQVDKLRSYMTAGS